MSPFQAISSAFEDDYTVNFRIERMDGSVTLTLSDAEGIKVRRAITAEQLADADRLQRVIEGIRLGLAIDAGAGLAMLLALCRPHQAPIAAGYR